MQDIVGPVRQKPYIQSAGPSLSQPREQLRVLQKLHAGIAERGGSGIEAAVLLG